MKKRVWQLAAVITLILWLGMGSGCNTIGGAAAGAWQDVKQGVHRMDQAMAKDRDETKDRSN